MGVDLGVKEPDWAGSSPEANSAAPILWGTPPSLLPLSLVCCGELELAGSNPEANSAAAAVWGWCGPYAGLTLGENACPGWPVQRKCFVVLPWLIC